MKLKTHKAAAKRIKVTPKKKIIQRTTHQDHFNARERATKTRAKRKNKTVSRATRKKIRKLLPHAF